MSYVHGGSLSGTLPGRGAGLMDVHGTDDTSDKQEAGV